jgi:hypothetical protein
MSTEQPYIKFYHTFPIGQRPIVEQAPVDREWMDNTSQGYAYRCLPMTYASRHGWCVRLLEDVEVIWDAEGDSSKVCILSGDKQNGLRVVDNGTGNGIVTFHLNAVPRTPPDWNLWIMGAPNLVIPGASPLSGVVESDWMFSSPTSNWKVTVKNKKVTFKKGDPVIFFVPVHKFELEQFTIEHHSAQDYPEINTHLFEFNSWRAGLAAEGKSAFGKAYTKGQRVDGSKPEWEHNHKTRLHLHSPDPNAEG